MSFPHWPAEAVTSFADAYGVTAWDIIGPTDCRVEELRAKFEIDFVLAIALKIESEKFEVAVLMPKEFPLVLPKAYLLNATNYRGRPHIENEGKLSWICYIEAAGHVTDLRDKCNVLQAVLIKIMRALESGRPSRRDHELALEFETYWSKQPSCNHVTFDIANLEKPMGLKYCRNKKGGIVFIADDAGMLRKSTQLKKKIFSAPAVYIPINHLNLRAFSHSQHLYPRSFQQMIGMPRAWAGSVMLHAEDATARRHVIIFGWQPPFGKRLVFGIDIQTNGQGHPLVEKNVWRSIIPLSLNNCNSNVLITRGGGNINLISKKAMIIGCGSLGGTTAMLLAKAGVGKITLVDYDIFEAENVQRHILGKGSIGKPKVDALAEALEAGSNDVQIEKWNMRLAELIYHPDVNFGEFDVIISATGDHDTDRIINRHLWRQRISTPLIVQWVEAYGVGAHIVAARWDQNCKGCLECLFSRYDKNGAFTGCASAFTAPDQQVSKVLVGCAGSYTPFGFLDSFRCSERAAFKALRVMQGEWDGFSVESFKGDAVEAERNGLRLAERYGLQQIELDNQLHTWHESSCQVCQHDN